MSEEVDSERKAYPECGEGRVLTTDRLERASGARRTGPTTIPTWVACGSGHVESHHGPSRGTHALRNGQDDAGRVAGRVRGRAEEVAHSAGVGEARRVRLFVRHAFLPLREFKPNDDFLQQTPQVEHSSPSNNTTFILSVSASLDSVASVSVSRLSFLLPLPLNPHPRSMNEGADLRISVV